MEPNGSGGVEVCRREPLGPGQETAMRIASFLLILSALAISACGTTERTVVIQPAAGTTVIVPPSGDVHVLPDHSR